MFIIATLLILFLDIKVFAEPKPVLQPNNFKSTVHPSFVLLWPNRINQITQTHPAPVYPPLISQNNQIEPSRCCVKQFIHPYYKNLLDHYVQLYWRTGDVLMFNYFYQQVLPSLIFKVYWPCPETKNEFVGSTRTEQNFENEARKRKVSQFEREISKFPNVAPSTKQKQHILSGQVNEVEDQKHRQKKIADSKKAKVVEKNVPNKFVSIDPNIYISEEEFNEIIDLVSNQKSKSNPSQQNAAKNIK